MSSNSLDSLDYDPLKDLREILKNQENKQDFSFEELINTTKLYKSYLHKRLDESKTNDQTSCDLDVSHKDVKLEFASLALGIEKFQLDNKALMSNLRNIQTSKRNLTNNIRYFNNLNTVTDEYDVINQYLIVENYVEILPLFESYSKNLERLTTEYGNVVESRKLSNFKQFYDTLELKSKKYIKELFQAHQEPISYDNAEEGSHIANDSSMIDIPKSQFQALMKIISLFQDKTVLKNINNWIIDSNLLFEFKQIFNVNDEIEVTSLENLDRRFIFFKKILSNFISTYEENENSWFPASFSLSLKLTERFCQLTGEDLVVILKREFENSDGTSTADSGSNINSDLFMTSLEKCLEFEKYVKLKFKNQLVTDVISTQFKPYISIWITKQEDVIKRNINQYLADPKLASDGSKDMIIPSSMELFRSYKTILNESLQLITSHKGNISEDSKDNNDRVFKKLAKIYHNGINLYQTKIIEPLVIRNFKETILNTKIQDIIDYTVLVVNTCDYIVTTIEDLSLKLQEYCQEEKYKNKIDDLLSGNKQALMKLINYNISSVLMNEIISTELEFVFKEFQHINYSSTATNVTTNRYVSSLTKILTNEKSCSLIKITNLFYKEIYIYNLYDKLVNHVIKNFLESMVRILSGPTNIENWDIIKLWVVDFGEIIEFLHKFPTNHINNISATNNGMKRCSESVLKELNNKLGNFVTLLNVDLKEYTTKFTELTFNCDNSIIWLYMLKLKGIKSSTDIIALWNKQAVGKHFVAESGQWFIFTMSKFLQDGFIDYNNKLYAESSSAASVSDPWKKFLNEIIKVSEFKKKSVQQQRVISPSISNTQNQQQQQQGIQQKIGMLWNSI